MPIRYYSGVEGAGKTCMMTRDLLLHYKAGGRVLTFPGYELYGDTKRQVLSETLSPEEIISFLSNDKLKRQKIAIAIDEVSNFFNHHTWYNKICDILSAVLAQRRKLGVAVLMTGPQFKVLPPDIRDLIHEIVHCSDNHTLNHAISRGQQCIFYKEDMRGLLSNPRHKWSRKKVFYMKPWYSHYDTYAAVDALHQFIKLKIKGRQVTIGPDGKPIDDGYGKLDLSAFNEEIERSKIPVENPLYSRVEQTLKHLKSKGVQFVETEMLSRMLGVPLTKMGGRNSIGTILKEQFGAEYKRWNKGYDLSGVMSE